MVGFRDFVGTDFAPVSNKTAVKDLRPYQSLYNKQLKFVNFSNGYGVRLLIFKLPIRLSFCQIVMALRLFPALHLFQALE